MGLLAALLTTLAGIFIALGFVTILQVYPEGVFSDKFTWLFWMCMAVLFLLGTIACLLVKRNSTPID